MVIVGVAKCPFNIARSICITVGDYGTKNVSVIRNSEVSVVRGLLYY